MLFGRLLKLEGAPAEKNLFSCQRQKKKKHKDINKER